MEYSPLARSPLRQFVEPSVKRQDAEEKPVVVPGEETLSPRVRRGRERIAHFVEGTTEAYRCLNGSKTTHGILPLFDAAMVLLQTISEIFTRPMLDFVAHRLADGTRIGSMTIRRDVIRSMPNDRHRLLEKLLSCVQVPFLAQQGIPQIAIVVDCPIQITPLPMDPHGSFVNVPGLTGLALSFAT